MSAFLFKRLCLVLGISALLAIAAPASWAQEQVSCPPLPGTYVELVNQPYALCAGAETVNFDEVTYAKCKLMRGNSLSAGLQYPDAANPTINVIPRQGNIATVNKGSPARKGYVVSTYSPPAGAISPRKDLALYTCNEGGSYAQCDGGLCFTSTRGKTSSLWGKVGPQEVICSCPVVTSANSFQVFGPGQCPTTRAAYDAVCATNATAKNNGAVLYIGSPTGGPEAFAACLNKPVAFNKCERPAN